MGPNARPSPRRERRWSQKSTNNYAPISFNFGPTLLIWLVAGEPQTYRSILDADKERAQGVRRSRPGHRPGLQPYDPPARQSA